MKKLLFIFSVIALCSCEKQTIEPQLKSVVPIEEVQKKYYIIVTNPCFDCVYEGKIVLVYGQTEFDTVIDITKLFKSPEDSIKIELIGKPYAARILFYTPNGQGYSSTGFVNIENYITYYKIAH
jgi:hypothetical protein